MTPDEARAAIMLLQRRATQYGGDELGMAFAVLKALEVDATAQAETGPRLVSPEPVSRVKGGAA
jgi:hypothetical protein